MAFNLGNLGAAMPSAVQGYLQGADLRMQREDRKRQNMAQKLMGDMLMGVATPDQEQQLAQMDPANFQVLQKQKQQRLDREQEAQRVQMMNQEVPAALRSGDINQIRTMIVKYPEAKDSIIAALKAGSPEQQKTAGMLEFDHKTQGFTDEQKLDAALVNMGLKPRAVGDALTTAMEAGTVDDRGDAAASIAEKKKFAEMTGSSRAKAIDTGFENIMEINRSLGNISDAITAIDEGAGVGAFEKHLPSIKAATVKLNNIQGKMTLDVLNAATFGALSKAELDLARNIALPTGLNASELKQFLLEKQAAQEKLLAYYQEQIDFLDQGGTIAGFLRMKRRQLEEAQQPPQPQQLAPVTEQDADAFLDSLGF